MYNKRLPRKEASCVSLGLEDKAVVLCLLIGYCSDTAMDARARLNVSSVICRYEAI